MATQLVSLPSSVPAPPDDTHTQSHALDHAGAGSWDAWFEALAKAVQRKGGKNPTYRNISKVDLVEVLAVTPKQAWTTHKGEVGDELQALTTFRACDHSARSTLAVTPLRSLLAKLKHAFEPKRGNCGKCGGKQKKASGTQKRRGFTVHEKATIAALPAATDATVAGVLALLRDLPSQLVWMHDYTKKLMSGGPCLARFHVAVKRQYDEAKRLHSLVLQMKPANRRSVVLAVMLTKARLRADLPEVDEDLLIESSYHVKRATVHAIQSILKTHVRQQVHPGTNVATPALVPSVLATAAVPAHAHHVPPTPDQLLEQTMAHAQVQKLVAAGVGRDGGNATAEDTRVVFTLFGWSGRVSKKAHEKKIRGSLPHDTSQQSLAYMALLSKCQVTQYQCIQIWTGMGHPAEDIGHFSQPGPCIGALK